MNSLCGRYVIIVLNIREGRGFDPVTKPVLIEANLNGRRIESDTARPDPNPSFSTELVWEIEKKEVRKLRSTHVPLRVECLSLDENQRREKIGFALLSLRSAQAITASSQQTEHKWHRLLGMTGDFKSSHPELLLTLTIRDKNYDEKADTVPQPTDASAASDAEKPSIISVSLLDEGYIQIGPVSEKNERFTLSVVIGTAYNLDLLLPESSVFQKLPTAYMIGLNMFEITLNTKYFYKNLYEPIAIKDKFMYKLQAELDVLKLFFDQYKNASLYFLQDGATLASTQLDFKHFSIENLFRDRQVYNYDVNCGLFSCKNKSIPEGANGRKPFINIQTMLEKNKPEDIIHDIVEHTVPATNVSEDCEHIDVSIVENSSDETNAKSTSSSDQISRFSIKATPCLKSNHEIWDSKSIIASKDYKLYQLVIQLKSITWKKQIDVTGFRFNFNHPISQNVLAIQCASENVVRDQNIDLENAKCMLQFVSTPEHVAFLVAWHPMKVTISDLSDKRITEDFFIYTKMLLAQNKQRCSCSVFLNGTRGVELACEISVEIELVELDLNEETPRSGYELEPIILDESLIFESLIALNNWEKNQQELISEEFKRIQEEKFQTYETKWKEKKEKIERKLKVKIDECRKLALELDAATREMNLKKKKYEELSIVPASTNERIELKVTQMLEDDMNKKIDRIRKDKEILLQKIEQLMADKQALLNIIRDKENELEDVKRTTLTKEQTTCLLQEMRGLEEKYQQAQNAKTFFKEQWQRTAHEAHVLKSRDQQQIQQDIRMKKEELSQLDVTSVDSSDREECSSRSPVRN